MNKLKVTMFYFEKCEACTLAKQNLPEIQLANPDVDFEFLEAQGDNLELYRKHITEKAPVTDWQRNDKGEVVLTLEGKPVEVMILNPDRSIKMEVPIVAPNFFIFYKEAETYEFVNNITGYNLDKLTNVLSVIKENISE